jgi:hypothetical protein
MKPEETPFTPLPAHPAPPPETSLFVCGLCGNQFTHSGLVCGTCPMQTACELVRCPNCGFQFPRSSRIVDFLRRVLRRAWRRP